MRTLTEQKQTRLHNSEVKGNCMMTCYANYLGLDVEECPRIELLFTASPVNFWLDVVELWWKVNGYQFTRITSEQEVLQEVGDDYYFACGVNPVTGTNHMVIYRNGELAFDPLPFGKGVIDIFAFEYVKKLD